MPQLWEPLRPVRGGALRVAALGLHVASTLEPVSVLRSAAPSGMPVDVAYLGHPCYGSENDRAMRHACICRSTRSSGTASKSRSRSASSLASTGMR